MAKNLSRCSFKSPIFSSSSSIPFIKNGLNEGHKQLNKKKQTKDVKKIYPKKKNSNNITNKISDKKELNVCEYIYKKDKNELKLIQNLYDVRDCSIFEYGILESYKRIKYSFCKTCDKNLINPICEACVAKCHKGHRIKQLIQKKNIICTCGGHLHKINCNNNDYKTNCLCYEWNYIIKLNFYKNINKKNICYFCYIMCNDKYEKNNLIKFKENQEDLKFDNNDNFPTCSCDNDEVHGDVKSFVDYILKFFKNSNQIKKILHPNQIINMIFKSKKCFSYIFFQLEEFINKSKENSKSYFENFFLMDITCTTIYYSLKLIKTLINKTTFAYYCEEVDNYFSFNIYKSLILSLKKSNVDERSYWIFCRDYIYIFYKLYINKYIKRLIKLKIDDIQNLTFFQRIMLFHNKINNENEFKESKEITKFLLSQIRNIDIYQYNSIESIEYVKNTLLIFKKFSLCNLLSLEDTMNIFLRIEVIFNFLDMTRKSCFKKNIDELIKIEFKILSAVTKIILAVIYNYNDKIIYNILSNKDKYLSIKFITGEKIKFLFKNNKLGDLINKIVIRVISVLIKYYNNKQGVEKYEQILLNAIKILEFSLITNDNYMKNILQSLKFLKCNDFDISMETNKYYKSFLNENNNIEKYYFDYLNFIITEKELLNLINKSLDEILGEYISNFDIEKNVDTLDMKFTKEKNMAIIITQLFYGINKIFNIISDENKSEEIFLKNDRNNLIKKVLIFYFVFIKSSPDNPFIILSNYLLTEIIKLPTYYCKLIFKLFNECFKIISTNNRQLSNIKYIITILYNYLEQNLINATNKFHRKENECLLYYLEIIQIVLYDIKIYHTDNSFLSYIKTILINIIKKFELFKIYFKNKKKSQPLTNFENYNYASKKDTNSIDKIFIISIKLINDIFDFSSEKEREIINNIIDIETIIFALLNFSLDLRERIEFIRFTRKMLIDINFCDEKEDYYTSFIINKKDNLSYIKNNNLISNFNYPTKLFSFIKDFYSLSKFVVLKEKIKRKIKNNKNENDLSILDSSKIDECNKYFSNQIHNEEERAVNNKDANIFSINKEPTFSQMCTKCDFYLGIEKNFLYFRNNSISKKSLRAKKTSLNKNSEKISTSRCNDRRKSLFIGKSVNEFQRSPVYKSARKKRKIPRFSLGKNSQNENSKQSSYKENMNFNYEYDNKLEEKNCKFQYKNNITEKQIPGENKSELKEKDSILVKNNNIYYYPFFDYDFYKIIKFELDNYFYYTNDIILNNKNNITLLKDYFENGLLIPIIYYFKRVFLFIHKYTGEEVIRIYNLIEKSLNLKIYISKFSSKLWSEENENSGYTNNYESDLIENDKININKKESFINHIYFTDLKYLKKTIQALDELKIKNYSCLDYTFLYKIIEKEFLNMLINKKNLKVFDLFSLKKKSPNIIIGDEKYYYSLILKLIQMEEEKIENYENKTDAEKKLIRIYFLYKYNKNHFSGTIKELSLFNIFDDICLEFHCNYLSLFLTFLIEDYKETDTDINKIKYYFLYILLLYMPIETQSNIIELLGGIETKELGFINPIFQKLFKKLILSIIDYFNPSDKIDYSNYFITYNLIIVFKFLSSQYNSFFQYHFIKSLIFNYSDKIPERFMIKKIKIKNDSLDNIIKECSPQSSSSSENSIKYDLVDYFYEDNASIINPDKIEIDFSDFFLCILLKILLLTDNNEKRYELLNKNHLYLYDLFHIILDMLIVIIQGNKTMTLKNINNNQNSIIMTKKTENEHSNLSSVNLHLNKDIEIKNTIQIFIDYSLEIIFDIKMHMELSIDIKYKLLLFLMSIIEEQNCSKEVKNLIIRKLKINKILIEIGKLLKAYYIYEEEINDTNPDDKIVKMQENLPKLKIKLTASFKDHRDIDEKKNNDKKNSLFAEMLDKTKSFGKLNSTINAIENSKLPLSKSFISINDKSEFFSKLNQNYNNEEINEIYKTNNNNTFTQKRLKSITYALNTQSSIFNRKNQSLLYNESIINPEKEFNEKIKDILFDDKLFCYFYEKFYKSNDSQEFTNNILFQLSNLLYKCLKIITIQEQNEEAKKIIKYVKYSTENKKMNKFFDMKVKQFIKENNYSNKLKYENGNMTVGKTKVTTLSFKQNRDEIKNDTFNDENEDDLNERNFIEQFYIVKFFESITSTAEIITKEGLEYTTIFTKVPEFSYFSTESKNYFLTEINRGNGKAVKEDLLQNIDYFTSEIYHYKKRKNSLVYLFSKIPFYYFQQFSYYYVFIFNLFLLFTLEGDTQLSDKYSKNLRRYYKKSIIYLQNQSLSKWGICYKFISISYIIINFILIILWICFRFPLYYKLDKIKYINEYKIKQGLKLKTKIYIIFFETILSRKYIFILLYEIIFSSIGEIFKSNFFIVFGLLPIIQLDNTLYCLIKIMRERSRELLLVTFLSIVVIYILSNFSFFFFNNDYEQYIDYYEDNVCNSLLFCFLNAVDYGLRARGGIGDSGERISFLRDKKHYIGRILLDVVFFLLIIIIMIDLLFGIITHSFLDVKNEYIQHLGENTRCFICNVNDDTLKKYKNYRINIHKKYVHNIWNYVEYIISLKKNETNFLNYIDAYIIKQIEKKSIAWLPTYTSYMKKCKKKEVEEEDIDFEILEETKNKKITH